MIRDLLNHKKKYRNIQSFCLFMGYPRSGHSLYGALLDAHPNAVMSHELNAMKQMSDGYSKQKLFRNIVNNSFDYAKSGRKNEGYNYLVKDQFQGRYQEIRVIGDKQGGRTSRMLAGNPELLERFQEFVQTEIKILHIYRNPFDNIASHALGGKLHKKKFSSEGLKSDIQKHFVQASINQAIRSGGNFKVLDIRHEDFIAYPEMGLRRMGEFFKLEILNDWVTDCAAIVFDKPHKTRHSITWPEEAIQLINENIAKYDFLSGYTFNDNAQ